MDEIVARSLAKWPNVPAVYGWLELDRRGNWLIKGERIGNLALREFIAPQLRRRRARPLVLPERPAAGLRQARLHAVRDALRRRARCSTTAAAPVEALETFLDDEGSVLIRGGHGIGLLDDRDLERYADSAERLPRIARSEVAARFGFVADPRILTPVIRCAGVFPLYNPASFLGLGGLRGAKHVAARSFLETAKTCLPSIS